MVFTLPSDMPTKYSPAEIVGLLEMRQSAHHVAATVAAFWPTIRSALLAYQEVHPEKVRPEQVLD